MSPPPARSVAQGSFGDDDGEDDDGGGGDAGAGGGANGGKGGDGGDGGDDGEGVYRGKAKSKGKGKANQVCWTCGQTGHLQYECPQSNYQFATAKGKGSNGAKGKGGMGWKGKGKSAYEVAGEDEYEAYEQFDDQAQLPPLGQWWHTAAVADLWWPAQKVRPSLRRRGVSGQQSRKGNLTRAPSHVRRNHSQVPALNDESAALRAADCEIMATAVKASDDACPQDTAAARHQHDERSRDDAHPSSALGVLWGLVAPVCFVYPLLAPARAGDWAQHQAFRGCKSLRPTTPIRASRMSMPPRHQARRWFRAPCPLDLRSWPQASGQTGPTSRRTGLQAVTFCAR